MQGEDNTREFPTTFIVDLWDEGATAARSRQIVQSDNGYRAIRAAAKQATLGVGAYLGGVNTAQQNGWGPPELIRFVIQPTPTTELIFPDLGMVAGEKSITKEDRA